MPARFSPAFPHCFPDDSGIEIVGNGDKVPEWGYGRFLGQFMPLLTLKSDVSRGYGPYYRLYFSGEHRCILLTDADGT